MTVTLDEVSLVAIRVLTRELQRFNDSPVKPPSGMLTYLGTVNVEMLQKMWEHRCGGRENPPPPPIEHRSDSPPAPPPNPPPLGDRCFAGPMAWVPHDVIMYHQRQNH